MLGLEFSIVTNVENCVTFCSSETKIKLFLDEHGQTKLWMAWLVGDASWVVGIHLLLCYNL